MADLIDGVVAGARIIHVRLNLDDGDPRIVRVFDLLEHYKIEPHSYSFYEFTEEERQTAPLLMVEDDYDACVDAGPREGTQYDLTNACPKCAAGVRQSSPLYVAQKDIPLLKKHRAIGNGAEGILVDGGMAKKLRDHGVTGIAGFGEVYARMKKGGRSLTAREQLLVDHTLPPQAPSSQLDRANACPTCHRGMMSYRKPSPFRTVYRRRDLGDIRDVNMSWEWFGTFRTDDDPRHMLVPYRRTFVTPKVMNIFRDAGVTTFEWTPIFVED